MASFITNKTLRRVVMTLFWPIYVGYMNTAKDIFAWSRWTFFICMGIGIFVGGYSIALPTAVIAYIFGCMVAFAESNPRTYGNLNNLFNMSLASGLLFGFAIRIIFNVLQ